jgi:hypothetical protein
VLQNGSSNMHVVIYSISRSAGIVSNHVYRNSDLHRCGHKNECLCERPDLYSFFPNKARILFVKCGSKFFESFKLAFRNFVPSISARKFWKENKIIKPLLQSLARKENPIMSLKLYTLMCYWKSLISLRGKSMDQFSFVVQRNELGTVN